MAILGPVSQTGIGQSPVIPLNHRRDPFIVTLAVAVTGTATYTVQMTLDDVLAPAFDPATAVWIDHASLAAVAVAGSAGLTTPWSGVRVKVTAGAGTAALTVVQAG